MIILFCRESTKVNSAIATALMTKIENIFAYIYQPCLGKKQRWKKRCRSLILNILRCKRNKCGR